MKTISDINRKAIEACLRLECSLHLESGSQREGGWPAAWVVEVPPVDCLLGTIPLSQFEAMVTLDENRHLVESLLACLNAASSRYGLNEALRCEPSIFCIPSVDSDVPAVSLIWKLDNNGTTLIATNDLTVFDVMIRERDHIDPPAKVTYHHGDFLGRTDALFDCHLPAS